MVLFIPSYLSHQFLCYSDINVSLYYLPMVASIFLIKKTTLVIQNYWTLLFERDEIAWECKDNDFQIRGSVGGTCTMQSERWISSPWLMSVVIKGILQQPWTDVTVTVKETVQQSWTDVTAAIRGSVQQPWTNVRVTVRRTLHQPWFDVTVAIRGSSSSLGLVLLHVTRGKSKTKYAPS